MARESPPETKLRHLDWHLSDDPGSAGPAPEAGRPVAGRLVQPGEVLVRRREDPAGPDGIRLLAGPWTEWAEDGQGVRAARAGRAYGVAGQVAVAWVEPAVRVDDPDALDQTEIEGDVLIPGPLARGKRLRCTGAACLQGFVVDSEIEAGTAVLASGACTRAVLRAGYPFSGAPALREAVERAVLEWDSLEQILALLRSRAPKLVHPHVAAARVIHSHLPALRSLLQQALGPPLFAFLAGRSFASIQAVLQDLISGKAGDTARLRSRFETHAAAFLARIPPSAEVRVLSLQDADVAVNGDVIVEGAGAFNSRIVASGLVRSAGILRGGHVEAGRVEAEEIGTRGAQEMLIVIRAGGALRCRRIVGNVTVNIGDKVYHLDDGAHDVELP